MLALRFIGEVRATLDRMATVAARRLLAWIAQWVDPAQQTWLEAMRAELDVIDGGVAQLLWAVGGLQLIWLDRRQLMLNASYRYGLVLLHGLEATLFVGLTWSLIQHYGSLVVLLLEMTGLCLVVAVPVLYILGNIIRRLVPTRGEARHFDPLPERRIRPLLPLVFGVLSLTTLLVLWLSAPIVLNQLLAQQGLATAGAVVSSADQHTAEAVFDQAGSLSHAEVYLTTQVKPLAVNGVPLAQLVQATWQMGRNPLFGSPPTFQEQLQALINKFTGIQGYDLAHGQFPNGGGMGFDYHWGETGSGYSQTGNGPPGRLLDAHDARTLNVMIPRDFERLRYLTFNNDIITVQSLVTGQTLDLHVVGQYEPDGSATTPLFGRILADDSVVQALTGGHPSYAYGLHLDANQLQTVFARLHTRVPTALLYNFLSDPIGPDTEPPYTLFTDPDPAGAGFIDNNVNPPSLLGVIAVFWAGLLAMIIILNRETSLFLRRYRN